MCPTSSPHLRHARVSLQLLHRSGQSRGCTHCSSLQGLFSSLFFLCSLLNHLLLEGRQAVPTPAPAGCDRLAEGSQLLGSPSLLGPAPALLQPLPNTRLLLRAAPVSCSPCLRLSSPLETQPFAFPTSLCPRGMQAARQRACPDGLIHFDFLLCIYSSFLESLFHWRLPERSRWRGHAHVCLWDGVGAELPAPAAAPITVMGCASFMHPRSEGWRDLGICGMSIWECASDPQTT